MIFNVDLPAYLVHINNKYLTQDKLDGFTEAYLVSVKSKPNYPLAFTVHLSTGALWSGLPIEAIHSKRFCNVTYFSTKYETPLLQPYSCIEGDIQLIQHNYLKNYVVYAKIGEEKILGHYMFTIDYSGEGLASDPTQYKTHNIIELENGQLAALPNNYCQFVDEHFIDNSTKEQLKHYKRNTKVFFSGS